MACGKPISQDGLFMVVSAQNDATGEVAHFGPTHAGECWDQAADLLAENRVRELLAFEHFQRLNADMYGEQYDPEELRYWRGWLR